MLEIRQSADKKFYNLLEIDDTGNEELLETSEDLKTLQDHKKAKGQKLEPIPEDKTRGRIKPE